MSEQFLLDMLELRPLLLRQPDRPPLNSAPGEILPPAFDVAHLAHVLGVNDPLRRFL